MCDRTELLVAAQDSLPDGFALMDMGGTVVFWNRAASAITGYSSAEIVGRPVRKTLEIMVAGGAQQWMRQTDAETAPGRGSLLHARHKLGHEFPVMVRILVLRDDTGNRVGTAALFHPAERLDALPHGESGEGAAVEASQAELEEKLENEFEDAVRGHIPFGVLWVTVDQAHELRRTHGARACEAMLEKVANVLAHGLRPGEEVGRWGDDEFLVLSHERTADMLACHARVLAGLARTADFRWWGDRISLTVSIGAAQAEENETLSQMLDRAREGMRVGMRAGGNCATPALERQPCSPS